jgi:hypothetical protein
VEKMSRTGNTFNARRLAKCIRCQWDGKDSDDVHLFRIGVYLFRRTVCSECWTSWGAIPVADRFRPRLAARPVKTCAGASFRKAAFGGGHLHRCRTPAGPTELLPALIALPTSIASAHSKELLQDFRGISMSAPQPILLTPAKKINAAKETHASSVKEDQCG